MFHYFQNFSPPPDDDFCHPDKSNSCLGCVVPTSIISDYDLGGDEDLFKAPNPIIEPAFMSLDPMSLITCVEAAVTPHEPNATDTESLHTDEFTSGFFYECNDSRDTSPLSEVLNFKPTVAKHDNPSAVVKSTSFDSSLSSTDGPLGPEVGPAFSNETSMQRAFSEGCIKTRVVNDHAFEDRKEKLSRYRNKKTKRNFGRKIKYACRKALADGQPRIKGRFAKTEETEILRKR